MTNWLKAYTISGFPCSANHLTAFASIVITIQKYFSSQSTDTSYLAKPCAHPADIVKKTHRTHCIHVHWYAAAGAPAVPIWIACQTMLEQPPLPRSLQAVPYLPVHVHCSVKPLYLSAC